MSSTFNLISSLGACRETTKFYILEDGSSFCKFTGYAINKKAKDKNIDIDLHSICTLNSKPKAKQ